MPDVASSPLLLRFIHSLNFPNTKSQRKHKRTYPFPKKKRAKTFPRSFPPPFPLISWSSTRKRDVSKLRGIGQRSVERRVHPLLDSQPRPNFRFEGPLSSRPASKRVFASSVTGTRRKRRKRRRRRRRRLTPVNIVDRESRDTSRRGIYEAASFVSA